MSPDDLIAEFKELAQADPEIAIHRTQADGPPLISVTCLNPRSRTKFLALASDVVRLIDPGFNTDSENEVENKWCKLVLEAASDLIENNRPVGSFGILVAEDGKTYPHISQTIRNAADASALVVRRCREKFKVLNDQPTKNQQVEEPKAISPNATGGAGGEVGTTKVDDAPEQAPALTNAQRLTLRTLADFNPSILASAEMIAGKMDPGERLSDRTIGPAIAQLVTLELAERPEGDKQGARLTMKGRRLASKIAD